jgi:hypothetical protein
VTVTLTLYSNGAAVETLPSPTTSLSGGGGSSAGSAPTVSFDTSSSVVRTASLQIVDPTGLLIPGVSGNSTLSPAGNEILIQVTDSTGTLTDVGLFGIVTTETADSATSPGPVVSLSLSDRAFALGQATPTQTVQIGNNTPLETATYTILNQAGPWIPNHCYALDATGLVLPSQIVDTGANPFTTCAQWWAAVGGVLYCDQHGNIIGTTGPVSQVPYAEYSYGDGTLQQLTVTQDRSQAYNGVTVQTSNPSVTPVQATAWDTDPTSPTYYLGPFGLNPAPPVTSDTAANYGQCLMAAINLLPTYLGLSRTVSTTILPDPHLLPYASATITSSRDGVSGLWYAQSGSLTLDGSAAQTVSWVPAGQPVNWGQSA